MGEEPRQGVLLDGLDLTTQARKRLATDLAEDFGVAPFAMKAAGTESAFEHAPFNRKLAQYVFNSRDVEAEALGRVAQRERPVGSRVTAHEFEYRMSHGLKQRRGDARR